MLNIHPFGQYEIKYKVKYMVGTTQKFFGRAGR